MKCYLFSINLIILILGVFFDNCECFQQPYLSQRSIQTSLYQSRQSILMTITTDKDLTTDTPILKRINKELFNLIQEPAAVSAIESIQESAIVVPSFISDAPIKATYIKEDRSRKSNTAGGKTGLEVKFSLPFLSKSSDNVPIVLLHGFDSSCAEFRRIAPLLSEKGLVYAPDILGWGFTDMTNIKSFGPEAKLEYLRAFLEQIVKKPCILVGASLGGGIALLLASKYPNLVKKIVLIDAQGFIDGDGPKDIADPVGRFGLNVLKSRPLRMYANLISYYDTKSFATWDAMRIGRLHCFNEDWERAGLDFLRSGGFKFSNSLAKITQPTLILWGKNDKILDSSNAAKMNDAIKQSEVVYLDECGHVPHLEKPKETYEIISEYLSR